MGLDERIAIYEQLSMAEHSVTCPLSRLYGNILRT